MTGFYSVGYFLISLLFGLATFVVWVRVGLQYFRVSALHPIAQVVHRITDPLMQPIAKLLQIHPKRGYKYDSVGLGILVILLGLKYTLVHSFVAGYTECNGWLLAVFAFADFIVQPCNLLFYAVLIRALMSWINPRWQHPFATLLFAVTEPMLQWARRYLPHVAGLDFSPFVVLILLKVVCLFITASLPLPLV